MQIMILCSLALIFKRKSAVNITEYSPWIFVALGYCLMRQSLPSNRKMPCKFS